MGYNYNSGSYGNSTLKVLESIGLGAIIWTIIAFIVALAGCFVVYFLFVKKDIKSKSKFVLWLQDFLRFDKMLIEPIVKIAYIFSAIFITLWSFTFIGINFLSFLMLLIGGNVASRLVYEFSMILIMLWKNTNDINKKIKK